MELNRYLDLYLSESHDHMRLLNQALLTLESGDAQTGVEEAFRAAHTLKGMSATMGFKGVSEMAHGLESLLDKVRSGTRAVDVQLIDELLASTDTLERAIADAASGEPSPDAAAADAPASSRTNEVKPGARAVYVTLRADEPMKAPRAMIITITLVKRGLAERSEPADFGEAFDGQFTLVLPSEVDAGAVAEALASYPEIAHFTSEPKAAAPEKAATAPKPQAKTNFLRVDQRRLDEVAEVMGEMAILQGRVEQLAGEDGNQLSKLVVRMSRLIADLQHSVLAMRMVPVGDVFDRFPRMVRDAARSLGKDVDFQIEGRDIEIDRSILEEIADPLVHLLRNAVDHGIEPPAERVAAGKPEKATLVLRAWRDRSSVRIQVQEDGRGANAAKIVAKARARGIAVPDTDDVTSEDLLRILAHPGFSTAEQVTDVSGRGVGLDAVVNRIRVLGGAVDMNTLVGEGTTFTLRLPITLAIAQALRVRVGDEDYAIPLTHVVEAVEFEDVTIESVNEREVVYLREEILPLVRLRKVLRTPGDGVETAAVVAELGERRTALAVDALIGREQILVKQFDSAVGTLPIFSGVTLLADGRPALVLDPISVV